MIATITLIYLVIVYLACLLFVVRNKDFLNPLHVFLLSMVLPYITFYFIGDTELHEETYLLYILTVTSFAIGYFYAALIPKLLRAHARVRIIKTNPNDRFRSAVKPLLSLFLIIGLAGFVLAAVKAYQFSQMGPRGPLFNLRYANTILGADIGIPKYMLLFLNVAVLSMIVFRKNKHSNKAILILSLIWAISSLFTMARTGLLLAILSVSAAYYLSSRFIYGDPRLSLKPFIVGGFLFGLGFAGVAFATHKIASTLLQTFLNYFIGPIVAFDRYMLGFNSHTLGWNTFYPITKLLSILGYQFHTIGPYVPPGKVNVFTMMGGPYLDYGPVGLVIVPFLLGLMYAFIYRRVKKGNYYYIIFYSLFIFPLAMSFFAYQYALSSWPYYIGILVIIKILVGSTMWVNRN